VFHTLQKVADEASVSTTGSLVHNSSDNSYTAKFNVANSGLSDWGSSKVHAIQVNMGSFRKTQILPSLKARESMVYSVNIPENQVTFDAKNQAKVLVTYTRNIGDEQFSQQTVTFDKPPAAAPSLVQSLANLFVY